MEMRILRYAACWSSMDSCGACISLPSVVMGLTCDGYLELFEIVDVITYKLISKSDHIC